MQNSVSYGLFFPTFWNFYPDAICTFTMFRQNSQARTSSVRSKIYQLAEALKICGAPCTLHIWDVQSLGLLGIVNRSQQKNGHMDKISRHVLTNIERNKEYTRSNYSKSHTSRRIFSWPANIASSSSIMWWLLQRRFYHKSGARMFVRREFSWKLPPKLVRRI